jgi:8-oxo-dGTP pyrophosphatase MutT (NUDIX family)
MNAIAQQMFAPKAADANTAVRAGVGVFVRDRHGWILLEKRSDCGLWELPGGRIEPGESIMTAAEREVKEETGLDITITRLLGIYSEPSERIGTFLDNGDVVYLIDIILEAEIITGELACSKESEEIRFFALNSLPAEITIAPPARAPIGDYLKGVSWIIR